MGIVKIEGLYELAYRAHTGTSFSPEKRATDVVKCYESELSEDLQRIPESSRERYIEGYKKHLVSWLSAKGNCISSMIAGPSNFPVRRAEKANKTEHNRYTEFVEWREKVLKSIARSVEEAKPIEQKQNERWLKIKKNLESSILTIISIDSGENYYSRQLFVGSITGSIKTLAKHADSEMVKKSLDLIKEWNEKAEKPIITAKNSIWKLVDECEINREKEVDRKVSESEEYMINGVKIVKNFQAERLQIFFDGKPAPEMIGTLKKNAFKWSPSNMCWQRLLTQNAINAIKRFL